MAIQNQPVRMKPATLPKPGANVVREAVQEVAPQVVAAPKKAAPKTATRPKSLRIKEAPAIAKERAAAAAKAAEVAAEKPKANSGKKRTPATKKPKKVAPVNVVVGWKIHPGQHAGTVMLVLRHITLKNMRTGWPYRSVKTSVMVLDDDQQRSLMDDLSARTAAGSRPRKLDA